MHSHVTLSTEKVMAAAGGARLPAGGPHLASHGQAPLLAWDDGSRPFLHPQGLAAPSAGDPAPAPVSALHFSRTEEPLLLLLAGEAALVYALFPGEDVEGARAAPVAHWRSSCGMRFRAADWCPGEALVALLTQEELCIVQPPGADPAGGGRRACGAASPLEGPGSEAIVRFRAPRGLRGGPYSLCWADGGAALAVSWGGTLEVFRWADSPLSAKSAGTPAWSASACSRRALLLGEGEPMRCLAAGPGSSVVGTADAPLSLATEEPKAAGRGGPQERWPSGERSSPGAVIDLRGRFSAPAGEPGGGVPPWLVLRGQGAGAAAQQRAARIVLVSPVSRQRGAGEGARGCGRQVPALPLGLPMPDILCTLGDLAVVASSSGPPLVQIFRVATEGLEPARNLLLSPEPGGPPQQHAAAASSRLRGLCASADGGGLTLHALHAIRQAEGTPVVTADMAVDLSVATYKVPGEGPGPEPPAAVSCGDVAGAAAAVAEEPKGSRCHGTSEAADLARLISGLQAHLDARLDAVERSLHDHTERLTAVERRMDSGDACGRPSAQPSRDEDCR